MEMEEKGYISNGVGEGQVGGGRRGMRRRRQERDEEDR